MMHLDQMAQVGEEEVLVKVPLKTLSDQNQVWTTLHYQLFLQDPNFGEPDHVTK